VHNNKQANINIDLGEDRVVKTKHLHFGYKIVSFSYIYFFIFSEIATKNRKKIYSL